ncbi:MAG: hypothetical protein DWQ34_06605 [Planctomycetota bacterium]|nr:MAG: hypothetical protein DWQ29_09455 [Planctomycetota bacterium]REJ95193.1 MAG: hypothetical protein DWQ34_06605 [Planctomycetota bacterium]REK25038.1 MAG: hypothetical protein DWQ41_12755 [Planctomycetota bacterium]REK28102.1 MAG: hypothetical protein DWQ45_25080 [Planctomycetota bacterium]
MSAGDDLPQDDEALEAWIRDRAEEMTPERLLLAGQTQEAIETLELKCAAVPNDSFLRNILSTAYLYAGRIPDALRILQELIEEQPRRNADQYQRCGVCLWILDRRPDAVGLWQEGTRCRYGDAAGNIGVPLLLYYAAVTAPELCSMDAVVKELEKRLASGDSFHWPGGIARMLVGRNDREEAPEHMSHPSWTRPYESAQLEFYDGIHHRELGDEPGCRERLQACVDAGHVGLYVPEWFLARHELGLIPGFDRNVAESSS